MRPSRYARWPPIALVLTLAAGGACACAPIEVSTGGEVSAQDVAAKAEQALSPEVRGEPRITCAHGLSAEAGDRTTCSMAVGGATYRIDAQVSRQGSQYSIDFHSDDYHPAPGEGVIFADEVARRAERHLAGAYGSNPDVECAHDLAGTKGRTVRCVLRNDGGSHGVTATVRDIDGSRYELGFRVDRGPSDAPA